MRYGKVIAVVREREQRRAGKLLAELRLHAAQLGAGYWRLQQLDAEEDAKWEQRMLDQQNKAFSDQKA